MREEIQNTIQRSVNLSADGRMRWTLTRRWGPADKVCFIGLNPSTADHRVDDPTVRRWVHFAAAWGFDGFTAVNLLPLRSSSPAVCRAWFEADGADAIEAFAVNRQAVGQEMSRAKKVVACWGAAPWANALAVELLKFLPEVTLHAFGKTASGAPIHPMARGKHRVPDDARPVLWSGVS